MCCFLTHAERSLPLLSVVEDSVVLLVLMHLTQMSDSIYHRTPLQRRVKSQKKIHTDVSMLLTYNHWWTSLALMKKNGGSEPRTILTQVIPPDHKGTQAFSGEIVEIKSHFWLFFFFWIVDWKISKTTNGLIMILLLCKCFNSCYWIGWFCARFKWEQ